MTARERLDNTILVPGEDDEEEQEEEYDMSYDFEDPGYLGRVRKVERGDPDLKRIDIVLDPSCRYLSGLAPLLTLKDA
jgi:hypothetical protein